MLPRPIEGSLFGIAPRVTLRQRRERGFGWGHLRHRERGWRVFPGLMATTVLRAAGIRFGVTLKGAQPIAVRPSTGSTCVPQLPNISYPLLPTHCPDLRVHHSRHGTSHRSSDAPPQTFRKQKQSQALFLVSTTKPRLLVQQTRSIVATINYINLHYLGLRKQKTQFLLVFTTKKNYRDKLC